MAAPIGGQMGLVDSVYAVSYSKAVSAGSYLSVVFTTPATAAGTYHMVANCESNLAGTFTFTTAASVSAGSALTAVNTNRNSSSTSGSTIVGTPTITTYGTALETHVRGANGNPSKIANGDEYILAPSTSYGFYFIANATSTYSAINLYFYRA